MLVSVFGIFSYSTDRLCDGEGERQNVCEERKGDTGNVVTWVGGDECGIKRNGDQGEGEVCAQKKDMDAEEYREEGRV